MVIAELIQDDIGGAMKDLISAKQLERFDRSINHLTSLASRRGTSLPNAVSPTTSTTF
jgi:hypothetical protein